MNRITSKKNLNSLFFIIIVIFSFLSFLNQTSVIVEETDFGENTEINALKSPNLSQLNMGFPECNMSYISNIQMVAGYITNGNEESLKYIDGDTFEAKAKRFYTPSDWVFEIHFEIEYNEYAFQESYDLFLFAQIEMDYNYERYDNRYKLYALIEDEWITIHSFQSIGSSWLSYEILFNVNNSLIEKTEKFKFEGQSGSSFYYYDQPTIRIERLSVLLKHQKPVENLKLISDDISFHNEIGDVTSYNYEPNWWESYDTNEVTQSTESQAINHNTTIIFESKIYIENFLNIVLKDVSVSVIMNWYAYGVNFYTYNMSFFNFESKNWESTINFRSQLPDFYEFNFTKDLGINHTHYFNEDEGGIYWQFRWECSSGYGINTNIIKWEKTELRFKYSSDSYFPYIEQYYTLPEYPIDLFDIRVETYSLYTSHVIDSVQCYISNNTWSSGWLNMIYLPILEEWNITLQINSQGSYHIWINVTDHKGFTTYDHILMSLEPPFPFNLGTTAGSPDYDGNFNLTWTDSINSINYSVYHSYSTITQINGSSSLLIEGLEVLSFPLIEYEDGTHYFVVVGFNYFGNFTSNCIEVIVDKMPQAFILSSDSEFDFDGNVEIEWTLSISATNYSIYYSLIEIDEVNSSLILVAEGCTDTSIIIEDLKDNTYYFIVISFNKYGNYTSNSIKIIVKTSIIKDDEEPIEEFNLLLTILFLSIGGVAIGGLIFYLIKRKNRGSKEEKWFKSIN